MSSDESLRDILTPSHCLPPKRLLVDAQTACRVCKTFLEEFSDNIHTHLGLFQGKICPMIAYPDLVAALANWRARQGLPTYAAIDVPPPILPEQPPTDLDVDLSTNPFDDAEEITNARLIASDEQASLRAMMDAQNSADTIVRDSTSRPSSEFGNEDPTTISDASLMVAQAFHDEQTRAVAYPLGFGEEEDSED